MILKTKLKNNGGITLIALVITIVVMLILAGVTINLTLGQNGIFTTAQKAAQNYTDAQNKEMSYLQGFTNEVNNIVNPEPLGTIIKKQGNIKYTADGAGNAIPVPVGFSPITAQEQGTKNTGFVIKNDTDGNEFVWVPVTNYQRAAWTRDDWTYAQGTNGTDETTGSTKITRDDLDKEKYYWTEALPTDEKNSVATYGGFYIGRYEAGVVNATADKTGWADGVAPDTNWTIWTVGEDIKLVVQDDKQVWNYITRDRALAEATSLYNKTDNNVISKLCSSYAWDSALKFIETQNSTYPTNSIGGNYTVATGGTEVLQKTGSHKVNNIYDMGGNAWEWTTESCSDTSLPSVFRGGCFYNSASAYPAAGRGRDSATYAYSHIGFRVTLYL